jgi:hypothetical protein
MMRIWLKEKDDIGDEEKLDPLERGGKIKGTH